MLLENLAQFLVAQIKKAIQDVESGNSLTFATGKVCASILFSFFFNISSKPSLEIRMRNDNLTLNV